MFKTVFIYSIHRILISQCLHTDFIWYLSLPSKSMFGIYGVKSVCCENNLHMKHLYREMQIEWSIEWTYSDSTFQITASTWKSKINCWKYSFIWIRNTFRCLIYTSSSVKSSKVFQKFYPQFPLWQSLSWVWLHLIQSSSHETERCAMREAATSTSAWRLSREAQFMCLTGCFRVDRLTRRRPSLLWRHCWMLVIPCSTLSALDYRTLHSLKGKRWELTITLFSFLTEFDL